MVHYLILAKCLKFLVAKEINEVRKYSRVAKKGVEEPSVGT